MRQKRLLNTNIISALLSIVFVVATLFCTGCATSGFTYQGSIYQGYEGPKKPPEQVATVNNFTGVITIDGKDANKPHTVYIGMEANYPSISFYRAELMPGQHTFKVYVTGHKSGPAIALIQATLHAGHEYQIRSEYTLYAKNSAGFAVMLVDKTTGEMVGGRTKDALNWSWKDVENLLKTMERDSATPVDVMEKIGIPLALYPDEMLPEPARRNFKDPFPSNTLVYRYTELSLPSAGYLFIKFDQSDQFQNYYFVGVPIDECSENRLVWDWLGRFMREMSCKYSLKTAGYVEYYAQSGNPDEAYHTLENGILNAYDNLGYLTNLPNAPDEYSEKLKVNVDQVTEVLVSEGGTLMKRYPEMTISARNSFTDAAFKRRLEKYSNNAATIERDRLAVYRRLVGAEQAQQAEREFSAFFGITLNH